MRCYVAALAIFASLAAAPSASASTATDDADRALDRALQKVVDAKGGPPGVISVVQRGTKTYVARAGVSEIDGKAPRPNESMRLASTSKAFSGAVALALVQEGKLELDDTVGELLPKLPKAWAKVTLRQVLSHTSGIPTFTKSKDFLDALTADPTKGPSDQAQLLSYVKGEPLEFKPGTAYEYSNSDNIVVALMAEEVTGRPYRAALKRYVFRPLGLRRTAFPDSVNMPAPFMHGYDTEDPSKPEDISEIVDPEWTGASGGLVSTPLDLNEFARGYVGLGLFGRKVRNEQFEFVKGGSEPPGPGRNMAGAGIFQYRTSCGTVYGHTGNIFGYTQFFAATKNGKRSVTVSATSQLSSDVNGKVFKVLLKADEKAVCAALAR